MPPQILILGYGKAGKSRAELNTPEMANKIGRRLERLAEIFQHPEPVFLRKKDFPKGDPDGTWIHFTAWMDDGRQFNIHALIKRDVTTDESLDSGGGGRDEEEINHGD
jgi:hypothetical protein